MGKNRSASGLVNVIQYDDNGNISFVSGSTTLMSVSSSGAITTTGVISGSSVQSASLAQNSNLLQGTGSVGFTTTASFTATSGSASSRLTQIEAVYATTGSNSFRATQSITGSLTVTGQIVAQTINVQQVTSSIVYSSGSNVFGCDINSRQTFTGSFYQTGSVASFSNCISIGIGNFPTSGALDVRNTIQPNKQIVLNPACGFGTYVGLYTDSESFYSWTNSSAAANNKAWRMGTPTSTPGVLSIQNMTDSGTSICGTPLSVSASGVVTVCSTLRTAVVDLNPILACPSNAGVGYGMFGYSGIGLGIVSAGTGANQGISFFTCGDFERLRILSSGVSCFSGTVCTPNLISTDATNTTLRISCAIVPLSNYRTSDCGYGGIDFFNNGKGYACSAKFYTFKTSTEFYGLTNDYNGSAQLSLIACGAGGGEDIAFFTGTSATPKVVIDNNATCITCQLSVGPSVTIGSQGGTDTTVIGGGSGVGSSVRMNFAGGAFNNFLAGNGDNFFNCVTGRLNAAGGVKFSGGNTTLNYYESGTWTPQLYWTGGGNYCMGGINGGNYVRIGNVVSVNYHLQWFGLCGSSGFGGQLRIGGLPFAVGSYRSAGTISAISSGIGRSNANITWHANTVDPGANFVYWIENDPAGGYSHSPSVGATGLVYSNQVTYTLQ